MKNEFEYLDDDEEEKQPGHSDQIDPLAQIQSATNSMQGLSLGNKDGHEDGGRRHLGDHGNHIQGLYVEIPSYEERKVDGGKNNVVFYKVVIGFQKNNKKWILLKRYSEFDALDKQLNTIYPTMPSLPGKTLFKLNDQK